MSINEADLSAKSRDELLELAGMATVFIVWTCGESHSLDITVEYRGKGRWGVYKRGLVLHREEMEFGSESMPSSRTETTLRETRFDALDEAMTAAKEVGAKYQAAWEEYLASGRKGYFYPQVKP